jgi:hypothetical protein
MQRIKNRIGSVNHLALFPETPEDEREIELYRVLFPSIKPGEVGMICNEQVYFLAQAATTAESEESRMDLYFL